MSGVGCDDVHPAATRRRTGHGIEITHNAIYIGSWECGAREGQQICYQNDGQVDVQVWSHGVISESPNERAYGGAFTRISPAVARVVGDKHAKTRDLSVADVVRLLQFDVTVEEAAIKICEQNRRWARLDKFRITVTPDSRGRHNFQVCWRYRTVSETRRSGRQCVVRHGSFRSMDTAIVVAAWLASKSDVRLCASSQACSSLLYARLVAERHGMIV